jgi:pilus assembly protein CpaF
VSGWHWQSEAGPAIQDDEPFRESAPIVSARGEYPADLNVVLDVHQRLISQVDPKRLAALPPREAREGVYNAAKELIGVVAPELVGEPREIALDAVCDEVLGLGPIEKLIRDPAVSEVMVNAPDEVYWEEDGIIYESRIRFRDHEHIMRIIQRIVAPLGRRVDESSPYVDARLPDGSRVNVIIPPIAYRSPAVTIRKFRGDLFTLEDLVKVGSLNEDVADFLDKSVKAKLNILISGGTGSGKTTLLNALSGGIPDGSRIVTIEDPAELHLQKKHVIGLEVRPANFEGKNEVTQRDLVRNALRMRPDRILVGEVRGSEAFDMMQAMNTGHEGSLTTVHANSPRDALARIENMVMMAGFELPISAIREQIASALHLLIHIARLPDGTRRVVSVTEVTGMEGQTVTMQDLFVLRRLGIDAEGRVLAHLEPTGLRPHYESRFSDYGLDLPVALFMRS